MKHLNEEELIEHYYGESNARVNHHLQRCEECAQAYAPLARDLAGLEAAEPPARDPSYGEQVWRSLSTTLPAYPVRRQSWLRVGWWRGIGYAAAGALLVLGAFVAGRQWEQRKAPTVARNGGATGQQIVLVVLGDHLDRAERLLVELKHADASSANLVLPMREEAGSLLEVNRLCRQTVTQIDDPALATTLDRLGRVLAELANEPGGLSYATISRVQNEMEADDLLFEIRVLRSRVPQRQPGEAVQSKGGTL